MTDPVTQRQTVIAFSVLLLVALLEACTLTTAPSGQDTTTPSGSEHPLEATEWVLTSLDGKALLEGTHISLRFDEGRISGFAGCNSYGGGPDSGNYVATEAGSLRMPEMAITEMYCPSPEGVMEQEQAYVQALTKAAAYRLSDDRLEVQDAAGETVLVYARQEATDVDPGELVGTAWRLVSLDGTKPVAGSFITLAFQDAQRISGHAGCRDYVVVYEAQDGDLALFYTAMLGAACAEEALLEQEGAYTTSLGWTAHYRLGEGKLELLTSRGEVLLFEPLGGEATLEGPTWSLLAFIEPNPAEGMPAPLPMPPDVREGTEITISFGGDRLRGSAGCNSYEAAYARDGSTLTMESIAVTEMACMSPEGVMEQEARYLGLLKDVSAYHVYGGQLWLEMGDGRALVFAVKAQPLTVALQPTDILVQLGWEGGFTPPEASVPFGRVPELTLLADGRLFYVDYGDPPQLERQQTLYAQLTPVEAQALVQRVLDLGFERLESYMDYCRQLTDGTSLCVADAGTSVLRVRLPGGDLRETRNYADFANDPEALAAIRTLLSEYRHPGAQPYLPEKATLFIRPLAPASDVTLPEWPLDPAWLTPPDSTAEQWARVLAGEERDRLLAVTSRNMGDYYLRYASRSYEVVLVPWLPSVDYTNMVASYRWP